MSGAVVVALIVGVYVPGIVCGWFLRELWTSR